MNLMNQWLLTLCLILLGVRAEAAGTTPWRGWWPWSAADRDCPHCCNDYCPKTLPCVQPVTCFGCNDYCPKILPCTAPCSYPSWYSCPPAGPATPCPKAP